MLANIKLWGLHLAFVSIYIVASVVNCIQYTAHNRLGTLHMFYLLFVTIIIRNSHSVPVPSQQLSILWSAVGCHVTILKSDFIASS